MLELEDGGVAPIEDAADIYFVKLEPEGAEHVGMVPRAAEDGETELARMTPVIFFIKSVPLEDKGVEAHNDAATVPLWTAARSSQRRRPAPTPGTAENRGVELARRTPPTSTSSSWTEGMELAGHHHQVYLVKMEPTTRSQEDNTHP